ncbi:hypothetical protein B7463_g5907, partial [Scytalidium lignicola]
MTTIPVAKARFRTLPDGKHEHTLGDLRTEVSLSHTLWTLITTRHLYTGEMDAREKPAKGNTGIGEKYGKGNKSIGYGRSGNVILSKKRSYNSRDIELYAIKEHRRRPRETIRAYRNRSTSGFCISSCLRHVNVINILDLILDPKNNYCEVMAFCDGGNLATLILRSKKLEMQEADCFFKQLTHGIEYMHSMGVAHRDLKPENLLLTSRGVLKIADFGEAECFHLPWEEEPRKSKGRCGTIPYIAPEQYLDSYYDSRMVDMWATGMIYMAMRTGKLIWGTALKDQDDNYSGMIAETSCMLFYIRRLHIGSALYKYSDLVGAIAYNSVTLGKMNNKMLYRYLTTALEKKIQVGDLFTSSFTVGMPILAITNFNIVCWVLGGFVALFGLVSYLFKEKFYLSEALISLLAGVIFSPHVLNLINPLELAHGSLTNINSITLNFSRLVLGVQLVLTGVQLPSRYLRTEWKSLLVVLGPILTYMWLSSSIIIWVIVPNLPFLHALAVGACVTPTDPVLSNAIVKGKFANKNVPKDLQRIIVAESGANDGLGYPFLFLALYMIKYMDVGGFDQVKGAQDVARLWLGETWCYVILLSIVYGTIVGWIARNLLHWTEEKNFVDRESFLVFAIALALFIIGSCGLIGSDDVLACFIAGNVFTWDDWFRVKTLHDSLQPTIDMLLNLSIFMWFGTVCPWPKFLENDVVPLSRLISLSIFILLLRRLPIVFALRNFIHQIEDNRQAAFVGFFGPVGVSAVFYLYLGLEFLDGVTDQDGLQRNDAAVLAEVMTIVVWFLIISNVKAVISREDDNKHWIKTPGKSVSAGSSTEYTALNLPSHAATPSAMQYGTIQLSD